MTTQSIHSFESNSPRLTRQEHKIPRELNPQLRLADVATNLRKYSLTANVSRYPRESLGGRRRHKGRASAYREQMGLDTLSSD